MEPLFAFLPLLTLFAPIIFVLLVVFYIIRSVKRFEKRADEKLALDKENTRQLQTKVNILEERLSVIEKMLKEVE
jgi:cytochrome c-type biogenesis protein CcmH/NrfF